MMSLFDYDETLCLRDNNKCKQRKYCLRFQKEPRDGEWVANYYAEFGQFCQYFIPTKARADATKAQNNQK